MAYSDCPQADMLTQRLVDAYQRMSEAEIESGSVTDDLHAAIMEHKERCMLCRRLMVKKPVMIVGQRVA